MFYFLSLTLCLISLSDTQYHVGDTATLVCSVEKALRIRLCSFRNLPRISFTVNFSLKHNQKKNNWLDHPKVNAMRYQERQDLKMAE